MIRMLKSKNVQDVVGPDKCLFVCPKPCFLFCRGYPLQLGQGQGWGVGGRFSWRMVSGGCM